MLDTKTSSSMILRCHDGCSSRQEPGGQLLSYDVISGCFFPAVQEKKKKKDKGEGKASSLQIELPNQSSDTGYEVEF